MASLLVEQLGGYSRRGLLEIPPLVIYLAV